MEAGGVGHVMLSHDRWMGMPGGYNEDDDHHRPVLARVMLPAKNVG